ncbi:MAG: SRPBCC domain-containing protein [Planctomycetaceae bacterium]
MVTSSSPEPLKFTRFFKQPPAVVFDVWTNPKAMRRWFRPSEEVSHLFLTVDLRVGGTFRVAFQGPNGEVDVLKGKFIEITPPHRLVYSWEWEAPSEHAGIPSVVTVQFNEKDGGTELLLCHAISDSGMKERHSLGWCGALNLLDEFMVAFVENTRNSGE